MPRSQNNEVAGGFTHWAIVNSQQVINSVGAVIPVIPVPAGGVVTNVCAQVRDAFEDGAEGSMTQLSFTVGDGTNAAGWITTAMISETAQREAGSILYGSAGITKWGSSAFTQGTDSAGATTANVVNGKIYAAADTIDVTFTTDDEFTHLVAGELFIGAVILDPASYS